MYKLINSKKNLSSFFNSRNKGVDKGGDTVPYIVFASDLKRMSNETLLARAFSFFKNIILKEGKK